jgi:pilus assembly protein Flp/PilA
VTGTSGVHLGCRRPHTPPSPPASLKTPLKPVVCGEGGGTRDWEFALECFEREALLARSTSLQPKMLAHRAIRKAQEPKMNMLQRLIKDESGATAIEYGLIAGLVAVAIIAALGTLGDSLNLLFSNVASTVSTAAT